MRFPSGVALFLGVLVTPLLEAQVTIPLTYVAEEFNSTSNPTFSPRLGIQAGIGGNALSELYLLDTGSSKFISAAIPSSANTYNSIYDADSLPPQWWGGAWWGTAAASLPSAGANYTYYKYSTSNKVSTSTESLGSTYTFAVAEANVTVGAVAAGAIYTTFAPMQLGQGTSYGNNGSNVWSAWQQTDGLQYPPEGNLFYGTFGSDLFDPTAGMYAVSRDYANWYNTTPSGQSAPVANGFLLQLRSGSPGTITTGIGSNQFTSTTLGSAYLTLGITPALMAAYGRYGALVPMQKGSAGDPQPYGEKLIAANFTITLPTGETSKFAADVTLDTGEGGNPIIFQGSNPLKIEGKFLNPGRNALVNGTTLTMKVPGGNGKAYTVFSVIQGGTNPYTGNTSVGNIDITLDTAPKNNPSSVNVSLLAFQFNDILFNMSTGQVGFAPVAPLRPTIMVSRRVTTRTTRAIYTLAGTASSGSSKVTVKVGRDRPKVAKGVMNWKVRIPLAPGRNTVTLHAINPSGVKSLPLTLKIVRG